MSKIIKRKTIAIRKYFFGAGSPKQFNWIRDNFHIWGIGVKLNYVINYDSLDIILDGNTYRVSTDQIKKFIKKYNSYYKIEKYKVVLAVFSKSLLRKINYDKINEKTVGGNYVKKL